MKAEHTPGPWVLADDLNVRTEGGILLHVTYFAGRTSYDQQLENAKLIAAAPDLLEALNILLQVAQNAMLDEIHQTTRRIAEKAIPFAQDAIRKATT